MKNHHQENLTITCADNMVLAGTVFTPTAEVKGAIMISPATGIKRQFYHEFARYLACQGYSVVTFDNRGIGDSLEGKVQDCSASLQCWGQQDMSAVFSFLQQRFPDTKYHLIGHSAGGQLIGLMENAHQLSSVFNFACSSGQLRNMKLSYRLKAHFFMNVFIPVCNTIFGYTKSQWVGMGEPLPKQVAQQWRQWCNGQGYVKMAFGKTIHQHSYHDLKVPSHWVHALDDDIANEKNVDDMISVFSQLPYKKTLLTSKEHGLNTIGHMGFFRKKSEKLWTLALNWLEKH